MAETMRGCPEAMFEAMFGMLQAKRGYALDSIPALFYPLTTDHSSELFKAAFNHTSLFVLITAHCHIHVYMTFRKM